MDDINILNLKYLAWCRVKTGFVSAGSRYNFASFAYNDKIFVFGGVGKGGFTDGNVFELECDEVICH